jgi:hypothetical protein
MANPIKLTFPDNYKCHLIKKDDMDEICDMYGEK